MAKYKLTDKHPLWKKLQNVWDVMEKEGIQLYVDRYGILHMLHEDQEYDIVDSEEPSQPVDPLPPSFEYKVVFEKDEHVTS